MSPRSGFLEPDLEQLVDFIDATFAHAGEGGVVHLRAFYDDEPAKKRGDPPFATRRVKLNGHGLAGLVGEAGALAAAASRAERAVVFAPPIATFHGDKADEAGLREGLVLSVELDDRPAQGRASLRAILGPPTVVVESGGVAVDPATGEIVPRLHVHYRLSEPTRTPEEHARLKRARAFACDLAGGDGSAKPIVHPIRWAGTVHRKNPDAPRPCRIVELNPAAEIALEHALAELEGLATLRGWAADQGRAGAKPGTDPEAGDDLLAACAAAMTNPLPPRMPGAEGPEGEPRGGWADWNRIGLAFYRASGGSEAGLDAFNAWSAKNEEKHTAGATRARWEHYRTSPPTSIGAGALVYEARRCEPGFRPPRRSGPALTSLDEGPGAGDALLDLSHDGLALALGEEWADQARHVALWGKWLFWNGAKWEIDERLLHMTRTRAYLRRRADGLVRAAEAGRIEGFDVDKAEAVAKTLRSAQTVAHVVGLARSNPKQAASVGQWDADPWLLGTPGGTVDLRTGKLRPAAPGDHITKTTAVAPAPPGTPAPIFQAFLDRIFRHDPKLIGFMLRVLGYGLTGLTTEHVLIFAWGQGANGKGTLFNTASRLLGDYAAVAPADLLLVTQNDRHPTDMAMLRGARMVTAQELAPGRAWDEPKLKSLTGGDPITARFMRQDFFTYEPQFLLVAAGNHKPSFKGVDEAIRRRVNLVPFLQNIPAEERDKDLPEKLRAEWPAILRLMIDGCLAWRREGLNPPESVRVASEDYLAGEDVLGQWLEERCAVSATIAFTQSTVLYADWRDWCATGGLQAGSAKAFSQRLNERGFTRGRDNKGKGFVGIGLRAKPQYDESAGCAGSPHIDRNAHAGAHTRAHTSDMAGPGTSGTEPDEIEF